MHDVGVIARGQRAASRQIHRNPQALVQLRREDTRLLVRDVPATSVARVASLAEVVREHGIAGKRIAARSRQSRTSATCPVSISG